MTDPDNLEDFGMGDDVYQPDDSGLGAYLSVLVVDRMWP